MRGLTLFYPHQPPSPVHKQVEPEDGEIAPIISSPDSHRASTCPNILSKLQYRMGMGEYPIFSCLFSFLIVTIYPKSYNSLNQNPCNVAAYLGSSCGGRELSCLSFDTFLHLSTQICTSNHYHPAERMVAQPLHRITHASATRSSIRFLAPVQHVRVHSG